MLGTCNDIGVDVEEFDALFKAPHEALATPERSAA
jgi:hypothetical protein